MTKITIHAKLNAPLEKTWNFYTQAEHITNWNFATDDWQCPSASNDLHVGGKYFARMEAKDGSFAFDFEAIYDEVEELKAFAYTMSDGRKVSTCFEKIGDQTKLITVFEAENENSIELQEQGWQAILNNFKKYVENN